MSKIRQSAVAGSFYPDHPKQLQTAIDKLMSQLSCPQQPPKALIVPHAGYYYSGRVAAHAYACIKQLPQQPKRIIILGPSHRVYLTGCALPTSDKFNTPLGDITIDRQLCQQLINQGLAQANDQAHLQEHSLEVQLPFLQHLCQDFTLVPIVVGQSQPQQVSELLALVAELKDTLVIISTDLSHFHGYQQATQLDHDSIKQILAFQPHLNGQDACGCHSVNGLLHYAKQQDWQIELLNYANSGDINHNQQEVVGYASFILF